MLLKTNDKDEILEMVTMGGLENGFEFEGSIPDDFEANFKPSYYLYQNNEIIVNPNYQEPTVSVPETPEPSGPSKEWQAINMLALQVAQLKAEKGGA